jgi:type 1 glutamine amidotransferase
MKGKSMKGLLSKERYGKGRIFHSTFGHDVIALSSVDAVVTFQRGVEWPRRERLRRRRQRLSLPPTR